MDMKNIARYAYEMGQLKQVKRSGWSMIGIPLPESIADHSFRAAILGYILASLAEADPMKTATICLFHDVGEARISDLHRVARRYLKVADSEKKAIAEQAERLPDNIAESIVGFFYEYEEQASLEGQLARDADLLECIFQAREYLTQGFADAQDWITNCYAGLQTEIAKKLADACLQTEPREWWNGLKVK